jgi:class 3 adenylate cyclase/pimeloyl-ACP methyl ester carboxylesterase
MSSELDHQAPSVGIRTWLQAASCNESQTVGVGHPQTKFVDVGGAEVAFQIVGHGPPDVIFVAGFGHIDLLWDDPVWAAWLERLASFSRLILFDRRGTGASDAISDTAMPTWEEWADDVGAVLDAAESERTVVLAGADTGPIGLLFTAMHPDRASALILVNTSARTLWAEDYPIGIGPETVDAVVAMIRARWGTADLARVTYPSRADDPEFAQWLAKETRSVATPRSVAAQVRYMIESVDARKALPLIQVPTLVLHTKDNLLYPLTFVRYLADHIDGAKFVELPGGDTHFSVNSIEEIAEFLTGQRPAIEIDRILTTVLFTDIVGSTERAASLGDQAWRSLLDAHDRVVRDHLRRFRGKEIKTTGDGFLASFDGPARAIRCGLAMAEAISGLGLELHLGLHTGECEVRGDDLAGLAVHIAARIASLATASEVLVSAIVKDLVTGSRIDFVDRGEHELKGVPGTWKLYRAMM